MGGRNASKMNVYTTEYDLHFLALEFSGAAWAYAIRVDSGTQFFRLTLPASENLERRHAK